MKIFKSLLNGAVVCGSLLAVSVGFLGCGDSSSGANSEVPSDYDYYWALKEDILECMESRENLVAFYEPDSSALVCQYDKKADKWEWKEDEDKKFKSSSSSKGGSSSSGKSKNSSSSKDNSSSSGNKDGSSSSSAKSSSSSSLNVKVCDTCKTVWDYMNPDIEYGELIDERDGQVYRTVEIAGHTWMAQNLNYDYGDLKTARGELFSECEKNSSSCDVHGRTYLWSAAMDSAAIFENGPAAGCGYRSACDFGKAPVIRGVCPEGWHIPTLTEWKNLLLNVGDSALYKLKSTAGWGVYSEKDKNGEYHTFDGNGLDEFGFCIIPAVKPIFMSGNGIAYWTQEHGTEMASCAYISASVFGSDFSEMSSGLGGYHHIRCMKDYERDVFTGVDPSTVKKGSFKDVRDGKSYKTVTIDGQTWMAENLDYVYLEPTAKEDSSSFCLNDDAASCEKYGRLYLWSAAMDSAAVESDGGKNCGFGKECDAASDESEDLVQGVCPEGWHLPRIEEWERLFKAVGGQGVAGKNLRASDSLWKVVSDDAYGFGALPAGYRDANGSYSLNSVADFWTANEFNHLIATRLELQNVNVANVQSREKRLAMSVRCVKD